MSGRNVIAAMFTAAMLGLTGCAGDGPKRDAGEFGSDAALTAKVKTAIAKDVGAAAAANINVNSYKGEVQLSGFTADASAAKRAGEVANGVDGVRRVSNDVRVRQ